EVPAGPIALRRQWKIAQTIADRFWKRWLKDYLPTLQTRAKWVVDQPNLQVGDFVMVVDPLQKRGSWTTGRVVKVHPGRDGIVRTVTVKTASGSYIRPASRIALLEASKSPQSHR
ncbi:hypothetical protein M514_09818, partial [Trichuris suis]